MKPRFVHNIDNNIDPEREDTGLFFLKEITEKMMVLQTGEQWNIGSIRGIADRIINFKKECKK